MKKSECLQRAKAALAAHSEAIKRSVVYASAFGGDDKLTVDAIAEADAAMFAASRWESIAKWHPATRSKAMRDKSLPASIFAYH